MMMNFFAPLRAIPMDGEETCDKRTSYSNGSLNKGRPPPIVLTSLAFRRN
jgi:hypothetical protein